MTRVTNDLEAMTAAVPAPAVSEQLETRQAQRDRVAAFLRAHPLEDIEADDLIRLVGPNYRSRVSECHTELGMRIENIARWMELAERRKNGQPKRKRLIGAYRFLPYVPLGREASARAEQKSLFG